MPKGKIISEYTLSMQTMCREDFAVKHFWARFSSDPLSHQSRKSRIIFKIWKLDLFEMCLYLNTLSWFHHFTLALAFLSVTCFFWNSSVLLLCDLLLHASDLYRSTLRGGFTASSGCWRTNWLLCPLSVNNELILLARSELWMARKITEACSWYSC